MPREEATSHAKRSSQAGGAAGTAAAGASGSSGAAGHIPAAQAGVQHPHMAPEYLGQHALAQDQDYRNQPGMYPGAVQSDPAAYGQPQPQMFDGMYTAYPHLPPQQVRSFLHCLVWKSVTNDNIVNTSIKMNYNWPMIGK